MNKKEKRFEYLSTQTRMSSWLTVLPITNFRLKLQWDCILVGKSPTPEKLVLEEVNLIFNTV